MAKKEIHKGLRGVSIGNSKICSIDGDEGTLVYRGYDISELAENVSYEETVYLLWFGELPDRNQLEAFSAKMAQHRDLDEMVWGVLEALPANLHPMEALRTGVSVLSCVDPESEDHGWEENVTKAMRLTAKLPTIIANYHRLREGRQAVRPDLSMSHAENFLYMLNGERPSETAEKSMDVCLVLMAEHEVNASTFSARVTASTLSDVYSAITTAIGTLKGPLHGGANQRAMEMMIEIGEPDQVEAYVDAALAAKKRIMGFGHALYTMADPRSYYLHNMLRDLSEAANDVRWLRIAERIAEVVEARVPGLYPNVDFFAAPLMYMLGIPIDTFTPLFAMSRIAGWTAHVMEQYENNYLLRPVANYAGPMDRKFIPIEARETSPNPFLKGAS